MLAKNPGRQPRPASAWLAAAAACTALANSSAVLAAESSGTYPQRSITLIVPFTPGTSADIIARVIGPKLSERWKVPVVTENRPGAGGNIGSELVARAAPDGYTLLMTATAFGTTPVLNKHTPFDPIKSFRPIGLAATSAMALVAPGKLPAQSVQDLIELARSQPGKLNYASPGTGTAQHLAMELLKQSAGVNMVHIPYKGTAGALTDVMGGHAQAMVTSLGAATPFVQGRQLKVLAVMSKKRVAEMPDAPTVVEQGHPELVVDTWYGLLAPAHTPDAIIAKWNRDLNELLRSPDVIANFQGQGLVATGGTPEELGSLIAGELARWAKVVDAAKIAAD
ncbi:MAG: tripartite tricarboxylate transporter substrate binding protein [Pigmentiphaga sp.]|uniref:Bug family tripartite tricarboxylate transporter substrate binding protein n=1 Tax=Pigmentiphaga sp. TaxID=1977564 RepID=UPI0029B4FAF6|nr:tripartite tricarboxylate transporter substrate binding protein [Pigmentiphaga sp.]MDX3906424.1 tripartite tricarboxylate transporter substrate binding protein [Pigmentiphaga sp.]